MLASFLILGDAAAGGKPPAALVRTSFTAWIIAAYATISQDDIPANDSNRGEAVTTGYSTEPTVRSLRQRSFVGTA